MTEEASQPTDPDDLIPAATVILGRNGGSGLEVLMLRRNTTIGFGGAWVFPGGRVDPSDSGREELERAQSAAVREAHEETGLDIAGTALGLWSYWAPPSKSAMDAVGRKRRFSTWFFVASAPDDEVRVDMGEIHEHRWLTPVDALALHRLGDIELIPPTWITLTQLSVFPTIEGAIESAKQRTPGRFVTRPVPGSPRMLAWEGDLAYEDPSLRDHPGGRNRLVMHEDGWIYERT